MSSSSAQTPIVGCGGGVVLPTGFSAKLNNWTCDVDPETVDTSGFIDLGYSFDQITKIKISGTASGFCITQAPPFAALNGVCADETQFIGTITLQLATGSSTPALNVVVTGVKINRKANGEATVSFNFKNQGPPPSSWAIT